MVAAWGGHAEVTKNLLAANANPILEDISGFTALGYAARRGHADVVMALLTAKADPNAGTWPPLLVAVSGNNVRLVEALLNAGANPNVRQPFNEGATALFLTENPNIVNLLLKGGADPEARARRKLGNLEADVTPLLWNAWAGWTPAARALLEGGANVDARIEDGRTALHFAAEKNNRELMELLLAHKADVNARDNQGLTPLDYAEGRQLH